MRCVGVIPGGEGLGGRVAWSRARWWSGDLDGGIGKSLDFVNVRASSLLFPRRICHQDDQT